MFLPFYKIASSNSLSKEEGFIANQIKELIGKTAITYTVLKPSGKITIDGEIHTAEARNGFIDKGKEVEVIGVDTSTLIVKLIN